jgi:hypothetical protein
LLAQVAVGLKSSLGIVREGLYLGHLRIGRGLLLRYVRVGLMSVVGSVDISFKDDVTVILLLGVSFMATTLGWSMSRIFTCRMHTCSELIAF